MDRIATLRNIEEALTEFEDGELTLDGLEERVTAVLRTYATDYSDEYRGVYRVDGVVVVAKSPGAARDRAAAQADIDAETATVTRLSK